jgi:SNF2 family DNA or RNA helicase
MARVHRIGQQNEVLVLRLVSVGPDPDSTSVEEHVLSVARTKLERERRIIGACVRVCVRACVRACVRVCVC